MLGILGVKVLRVRLEYHGSQVDLDVLHVINLLLFQQRRN
jgi:hypothetical protein